MNSKIVLICVAAAAVLLAVCLSEVDAKKAFGKVEGGGKGHHYHHHHHHHHHRCLGVELKFDDDVKTSFKECMGTKKDNEQHASHEIGEHKKKFGGNNCTMLCIFKKNGLVNEDGELDSVKIEEAIKKVYPEAAQEGIIAAQKECSAAVTEKITDADECKSFHSYTKCYFSAIKKNCHKD